MELIDLLLSLVLQFVPIVYANSFNTLVLRIEVDGYFRDMWMFSHTYLLFNFEFYVSLHLCSVSPVKPVRPSDHLT